MGRDTQSKHNWYLRNKQFVLDTNKRIRAEKKAYIREVKSVACADCNVVYPYYVMDFDHRDESQKRLEPN